MLQEATLLLAVEMAHTTPIQSEIDPIGSQVMRRRFTVQAYSQMRQAGILTEDERVELIDGEVREMSPIDPIHAATVNRLNHQLADKVRGRAIISVQNPIRLDAYNEPQPDLTLLRWDNDFYEQRHPLPKDILIAMEVANTSLVYDRREKLPRYAAAGIPEVWLINIGRKTIEQYTKPADGQYTAMQVVVPGQQITAHVINELQIAVEQIFGRQSS